MSPSRTDATTGTSSPGRAVPATKQEPEPKNGFLIKITPPAWVVDSVKLPRTWKTFARCMITTFAVLVLMLDQTCQSSFPSSSSAWSPLTDQGRSAQYDRSSCILHAYRIHHAATFHGFQPFRLRRWYCGLGHDGGMGLGLHSDGGGVESEKSSSVCQPSEESAGWVSVGHVHCSLLSF